MAALGRQVLDWHRLVPLTWAGIARQTPRLGEQERAPAPLLRKLTTASSGGGGLVGLPRVEPRKDVQKPECWTSLARCHLHKQRAPVEGGSLEREEVIRALLDMGFSDVHAQELLSIQPSPHPRQLLDIVSELILLGVNPEPVCVALKKSPQLLKLPVMHVKKRSAYLRKLGLEEGKLKRVLHCCPEVLTMSQRDIDSIVRVLREKCLFTAQQVTEVLHRCPQLLREAPGEVEYKFQKLSFWPGRPVLLLRSLKFSRSSWLGRSRRSLRATRLVTETPVRGTRTRARTRTRTRTGRRRGSYDRRPRDAKAHFGSLKAFGSFTWVFSGYFSF
uniref:Mitochondrial transcription termination factor 4 n=1 Tax=Molossus molossus TaxID=27622 RepID=A0A7J8FSM1_MOLMO|nr:mitochondrial transcription termination factor 4 [Molossus molossus]